MLESVKQALYFYYVDLGHTAPSLTETAFFFLPLSLFLSRHERLSAHSVTVWVHLPAAMETRALTEESTRRATTWHSPQTLCWCRTQYSGCVNEGQRKPLTVWLLRFDDRVVLRMSKEEFMNRQWHNSAEVSRRWSGGGGFNSNDSGRDWTFSTLALVFPNPPSIRVFNQNP